MPFGKHKGTRLDQVPVRYLLWLWKNGLKDRDTPLAAWIWQSFDDLIVQDQAEACANTQPNPRLKTEKPTN